MATSAPPTSAPAKSWKVRNVCFTLNNYTDEERGLCKAASAHCTYLVFSEEIGDSGTPHLQGYAEFANSRSTGEEWSNLKKLFGSKRYHFENRKAKKASDAADYCKGDYTNHEGKYKPKNDIVYEYGEISNQGHRTDWDNAVLTLQTSSVTDVIQSQPQLLPAIRALERYKQLLIEPIQREVRVIVLIGPPGTGKSRYVWETSPNLYSKPSGQWWDGYNGEEEVLLDDYYGDIEYSELLKVLDRYKYRVPVKGAYIGARWKTVYITSNKPVEKWYPRKNIAALKRRITEIKILDTDITNGSSSQVPTINGQGQEDGNQTAEAEG